MCVCTRGTSRWLSEGRGPLLSFHMLSDSSFIKNYSERDPWKVFSWASGEKVDGAAHRRRDMHILRGHGAEARLTFKRNHLQ